MLFRRIKRAPLSETVQSRDGTIYLYRGMKLIGWFPPKNYFYCFLLLWRAILIFFSVFFLPVGFLIAYAINIKEFSPGYFLTSAQSACNACGSSIKCIVTLYYSDHLRKALNIMDRLDRRHCSYDSKQLKIRDVVARCNYIFLLYCLAYYGFGSSTYLSSLYNGHPAWQLYNPFFNWRDNSFYLWIQSTFEFFCICGALAQNMISDSYPVIYIMLIRSHIQMLQERVDNLRSNNKKSANDNYEELVQCILDHKMILKLCDIIKPGISITMFIQFLICGLIIGLTVVNMVFFSDNWTRVATFLYLIVVVIQTFPFACMCDFILQDGNDLMNAIFHSNWFDADRRYKKALIYFMHNVQKPILFTAMGVFDICTRTNLTVAKFAFTVFTLAKQMNLAERFK